MTNKLALGLMGGGSLTAGLGVGYGVGVSVQPSEYEDFMDVFYANLIKDAKEKVKKYEKETDAGEKNKTLKDYVSYVCVTVTEMPESYNQSESAKKRLENDRTLCSNSTNDTNFESNKSEWETHFKKWPQNLKEEWEEFKKYTNKKPAQNGLIEK